METVRVSFAIFATFGIYILVMLGIGFYFWKKTSNATDFFLGGRDMGPTVSALSAGASDMSSWLLMGLPGALYATGVVDAWIAIGLSIGAFLNWSLVAKRLRIFTGVVTDSLTVPDYFASRFHDKSHALRIISAIVILVFFTIYISSGLIGGAKLFEGTFHLNYNYALVIGALVIVLYTFFGGYMAVSWTDLVQGLLMFLALVVLPIVLLYHLGGVKAAFDIIINYDTKHSVNHLSFTHGVTVIGVISSLAWGLGYFGQPHIIVRFMSIRHVRDIPKATTIGIGWMVLSLIGACLVGLLGFAYVLKFNLDMHDPEKVFIVMSQLLFNPWITGILLSALLAAIMSTASSQLLVSSSSIAEDFYKKILKKDASPRSVMIVSRIGVLIVAVVAFFLSVDKNSSILSVVAYAWAGFGASFGSVVFFSLFWRRMTTGGAIAGMIVGAVVVVIHKNFTYQYLNIYEIVPGFVLASIAIIVVSYLQKPNPKVIESYDEMVAETKVYKV
ncbi:sodium/proline symporter PutP [Helicobacter sp. 11S02629-2]|uniref:sodium/proline symporter PutP n=1 Tax=Helicobacter sp. 11S02629-2 TaxID=1476195 RepID=UPI000BA4E8BB|nr:sodium/proline symporter PutP [Helicobacter sp. 11S02629-2]PAF46040.1 sodium/proline symporter [Helicobacter sp. 11S02629-2]